MYYQVTFNKKNAHSILNECCSTTFDSVVNQTELQDIPNIENLSDPQIIKDSKRNIYFGPPEEIALELARLSAKTYPQGSEGRIALMATLKQHYLNQNLDINPNFQVEPNYPLTLGFYYLNEPNALQGIENEEIVQKNKFLKGFAVYKQDSKEQRLSFCVTEFKDSNSYEDANFTFFLPEEKAKLILQESVIDSDSITKLAVHELAEILEKTIHNNQAAEVAQALLSSPELLDNDIFVDCQRKVELNLHDLEQRLASNHAELAVENSLNNTSIDYDQAEELSKSLKNSPTLTFYHNDPKTFLAYFSAYTLQVKEDKEKRLPIIRKPFDRYLNDLENDLKQLKNDLDRLKDKPSWLSKFFKKFISPKNNLAQTISQKEALWSQTKNKKNKLIELINIIEKPTLHFPSLEARITCINNLLQEEENNPFLQQTDENFETFCQEIMPYGLVFEPKKKVSKPTLAKEATWSQLLLNSKQCSTTSTRPSVNPEDRASIDTNSFLSRNDGSDDCFFSNAVAKTTSSNLYRKTVGETSQDLNNPERIKALLDLWKQPFIDYLVDLANSANLKNPSSHLYEMPPKLLSGLKKKLKASNYQQSKLDKVAQKKFLIMLEALNIFPKQDENLTVASLIDAKKKINAKLYQNIAVLSQRRDTKLMFCLKALGFLTISCLSGGLAALSAYNKFFKPRSLNFVEEMTKSQTPWP